MRALGAPLIGNRTMSSRFDPRRLALALTLALACAGLVYVFFFTH